MAERVYPRVYGVAEVSEYLKQYLEEDMLLASLAVQGEISGYKAHSSGHVYFTLREGGSGLKAVMFRRYAADLQWQPQDGDQAVVVGRIAFYERDGACQIYAQTMLPVGSGSHSQALSRLKAKLEAEGLFSPERKLPLPAYALRVGVVTAADSAAWADIQRIASARSAGTLLVLHPAIVQGDKAPASIAAAVQQADAANYDVIICGRGGGAEEDLAAFNSEEVVRAIAGTITPLISAVGHESDITLADLAADVRAATPTHAATLAVLDEQAVVRQITAAERSMRQALAEAVARSKERLQRLMAAPALALPLAMLDQPGEQLDRIEAEMALALSRALAGKQTELEHSIERLRLLDPARTLGRGYAVVQDKAGSLVRSAQQVQPGDKLQITFAQGAIAAQVLTIKEEKADGKS
jgi:exodeoxyribonuclease VII large subunit